MMISMAGAIPTLEDATCRRTLWPDGTLFELVQFNAHNYGPDELTDEELKKWLESFPVDWSGRGARRREPSSSAAVSTVLKIMVDANSPASVRLRAADIVMDRTAKAIEIEDIEARVSALELASGQRAVKIIERRILKLEEGLERRTTNR
jgi:hypothetical protein